MKTDLLIEPTKTVFLQTVLIALAQLKQQLQREYEQGYPDLRELIHIVLDEEEARAWELTFFPHLLLPDLVEAHLARLNLQPANRARHDMSAPHDSPETYQPAFALCG